MDPIYKKIMFKLFANCRVSYENLSRHTGLSANAVKNRVTALIDNGTLTYTVYLRPSMIDAEYFTAVITTDGSENVEEFSKLLGESPMIAHISLLANVQGGAYLLWGQYIGATMLTELRSLLRKPPEVQNIEINTIIGRHDVYTVLGPRREKVQLPKLHLRILSILRNNPRAPVNDIAKEAGLAPKTVRRAIQELLEGNAIQFTARPDMAAGRFQNFFIRFEWSEKETTLDEIVDWLQKDFPINIWDTMPIANEPTIFAEFVISNLEEVEEIARKIRSNSFVKSTTVLIAYTNKKFPYLPQLMLDDMIREAGIE